MNSNIDSNKLAKLLVSLDKTKYSFLDTNNILWKFDSNNNWVGSSITQTKDLTIEQIKNGVVKD